MYKFHLSIISIKQNLRHIEKFSFRFITLEDARLISKDLKNNKVAGGDIFLELLKEYEFTHETLTNCKNNSISQGLFPDFLKRANITSVHKKSSNKSSRISILSVASEVYQIAIFNQLSEYMQNL